jgi:predicted amidohydrolase
MTRLLVAAAQAASVSGDFAANVATAARLTALAATQGVRVLVLPEAFLTGYDVAAFEGPLPEAADLGPWLDPLREAATAGVTVVAGTSLRRGGAKRLSQIVLRPDGTATAPYDKQHLDGIEKQLFTTGDQVPRSRSRASSSGCRSATTAASPSTRRRPRATERWAT